jgi:hypothetical protein
VDAPPYLGLQLPTGATPQPFTAPTSFHNKVRYNGSMAKLPEIVGALVDAGLSAVGVPGGSAAGTLVSSYYQRRAITGREILLDELRRGEIDAAVVTSEDDCIAVIDRYLRASRDGSARVNLRLIAKAIVGALRTNTLVADDFMPHADALASLSRDEIILIAHVLAHQPISETAEEAGEQWPTIVKAMEAKGWNKEHVQATAARAQRSGYVLAGSAFDDLSYRLSPLLMDLCKTVDFDDALRREANV